MITWCCGCCWSCSRSCCCRQVLLRGALALLLLIAYPSGFGLQITNFAQVEPHSSSSERVCFRPASIFFVCSPEAANEGIKASPSLSKWARARRWRVGMPVEGTDWGMDFGFPKLVQVAKEFKDMSSAAARKREGRPVVFEILPKSVPVPALLILVSAGSGSSRWGCSCRCAVVAVARGVLRLGCFYICKWIHHHQIKIYHYCYLLASCGWLQDENLWLVTVLFHLCLYLTGIKLGFHLVAAV